MFLLHISMAAEPLGVGTPLFTYAADCYDPFPQRKKRKGKFPDLFFNRDCPVFSSKLRITGKRAGQLNRECPVKRSKYRNVYRYVYASDLLI